jgi:lactate dehydrogenase-like 2-hydroxyacid dehydrogenase
MKKFKKALVYEFEGSDDLTKMAQEYAEEVTTVTATDDYQNVITVDHLKGVDFFLGGVFDDFKNEYYDLDTLKYIAIDWTGMSMIDLDFLAANNIQIDNVNGHATAGVSELMLNMLLNLIRHTPQAMVYAKADGESFAGYKGTELGSKTVSIYGLGSIGQRFAEICEFFGSDIRYNSQSDKKVIYKNIGFDELVKGADVLAVTTAVTPKTRNSLGKDWLSGLSQDAVILSPGTFEVFNIPELYDFLIARPDVKFWSDVNQSKEWKECKEKFLALDNVYVTPHTGFFTKENRARALALTKANIDNYQG